MTRNQQLIRFLLIFGCIWGLIHFYLFLRISFYLDLNKSQQADSAWIISMMGVISLFILPLARKLPILVSKICALIAYTWMGMAFLFLSAFFLTDVIWYLAKLIFHDWIHKQTFINTQAIGVWFVSILILIGVYALFNALRTVMVRDVNIHIKKLPIPFEGLRIVQISDIHIGSILGRKWLRKVVAQINQLDADMVFITGDLVDGSLAKLAEHVEPLKHLQSRHGNYFVTGNHEYYSGAKEWCQHLRLLGIKVLENEKVSINKDDTSIEIAGVNDWSTRQHNDGYNLEKALMSRDEDKTLILLSHQPATMHEAAERGVDLQLSGHTHGGQIWPFNYLVYLQQPFVQGLFQHPEYDFQMYVSPGTGFWGPPMRLATRAEITHITLYSSQKG